MLIHGWGRYPKVDAEVCSPSSIAEFVSTVRAQRELTVRGLGRSYGDSSLGSVIACTGNLGKVLAFDEATGLLTCESGVSFDEIIRRFVPRGWFLPVTPGTKHVTVGGAIASDVHGKNHHVHGSFSQFIQSIELLLGNGDQIRVSRENHFDLFRATCGGMGLTGIVISASFFLTRVSSSTVTETIIKTPNLDVVLDAFEENTESTYSVAWVDCLATGNGYGRSLLMLGEHKQSGPLEVQSLPRISIPFEVHNKVLGKFTVKAFNSLYYSRISDRGRVKDIHFQKFFYPLDGISNWNRLYGNQGLIQYQFVVPKQVGRLGIKAIHQRIVDTGLSSVLAVLKLFGEGNSNYLSFPIEGYTMAVDFKATPEVLALLRELDKLVVDLGGRIYLTKDARMSEPIFKSVYPEWERFESVRKKYYATGKFVSAQSMRLGLV